MHGLNRRGFFKSSSLFAGLAGLGSASTAMRADGRKFRVSLAEWSLHRAIGSRLMTNLDFPRIAREQFGIEGLEFANALWEAPTQDYVRRLKSNMQKTGTKAVLIMCDGEGLMGHSARAERMRAAANHYQWVEIAAELGCHAIRTNMYPDRQPSTPAEIDAFVGCCSESFASLCEFAKPHNISVLVENHGGISSNPDVMVRLIERVDLPNFGTLPDFGNFPKEIDRYGAVNELMAYAKGVTFKCCDFDPDGKETTIDMDRMMKIVLDAGFHGWVGIEYEGHRLTEFEGIQAAKRFMDGLA